MLNFTFLEWLFVFSLTALLSLAANFYLRSPSESINQRLEQMEVITKGTKEDKVMQKSMIQRIILMIEERVARWLDVRIRKGTLAPLELKLLQAGEIITPTQHWAKKILWACAGVVIGIMANNFQMIFILAALCLFYPDYKLKEKIKKRQMKIKSELPDFLDLLAATAPSAKSLEDAIKRVSERTLDGEVTKEFRITLDEVNAGRKRRDALNDLSKRCGIQEIKTLVSQINQSEVFGTGVEKTLQIQAEKIRKLKKVMAEIKARRASVMLLLPSMFLLFTILIMIAGPNIIQLVGAMGNFNSNSH